MGFDLKLELMYFRLRDPIRATQSVKDSGWGAIVIYWISYDPTKKNEAAVGRTS
jgi:hypothetical protein